MFFDLLTHKCVHTREIRSDNCSGNSMGNSRAMLLYFLRNFNPHISLSFLSISKRAPRGHVNRRVHFLAFDVRHRTIKSTNYWDKWNWLYNGVILRWAKSDAKILFSVQKIFFPKTCVSMQNFMVVTILAQKKHKNYKKGERKEEHKFCTVRSMQLLLTVKVPHSEFLFLGILPWDHITPVMTPVLLTLIWLL